MSSPLMTTPDGTTVAAFCVLGRQFMRPVDCPFLAADRVLKALEGRARCIIVDAHAEATAEKYLLGHYLKGRCQRCSRHTHARSDGGRAGVAGRHRLHLRRRHDGPI